MIDLFIFSFSMLFLSFVLAMIGGCIGWIIGQLMLNIMAWEDAECMRELRGV